VATRPERRPRGQDRKGAARCRPVVPFRDWQKCDKSTDMFKYIEHLNSQPCFLHFTVNHYILPPSACLFETSADQILHCPFYHSAADRLPGIQTVQ
jgi:hypothetical protein